MSEETPQPEVAAEKSSEPEVSALEKEMNALLATTQGVPRVPHAPKFAPPPHGHAEPSPGAGGTEIHSPYRRAALRQACWAGRCRPR